MEGAGAALEGMGDTLNMQHAYYYAIALRDGTTPSIPHPMTDPNWATSPEPPPEAAVAWLYDLALGHGLQTAADGNLGSAMDLLSSAAYLSPRRALEIPARLHGQAGDEHEEASKAWARALDAAPGGIQ
jgi:hypothetical protein